MVLFFHIVNIFFEIGLGIWDFEKVFPKRENWELRHILSETILDLMVWYVFLENFARNAAFTTKLILAFVWTAGVLFYRYEIEKKEKIRKEYLIIINNVLKFLEFFALSGLLIWNYWIGYISWILALSGNIFLPFFLFRYYQCGFTQAYIWEAVYEVTIQLIKGAYVVYIGGTEGRNTIDVNISGRMHAYSAVFLGILISFVILALVRYFSFENVLKKALTSYKWRTLILAIAEYFILDFYTNLGLDNFDNHDVIQVLFITVAVIIIVLILIINLFKKSLEAEKRLLDVRNDAIEQQYCELRAAYERNRCLLHDEKHMVQYLEQCLRSGDIERAVVFLGKYRLNMLSQSKKSWTGLPTLDFIINTKNDRMQELFIDFKMEVQIDDIPLDDADFVVLLGNLFDNAIEAAAKCPIENRWIMLQMQMVNDMFLISMENVSNSIPVQRKERFLTSKKDTGSHGWGIESIKHIVKKYGGTIDFIYDSLKFEVQIMIELEPQKSYFD